MNMVDKHDISLLETMIRGMKEICITCGMDKTIPSGYFAKACEIRTQMIILKHELEEQINAED